MARKRSVASAHALPTNVKRLRGTLRKHRTLKNEPNPPSGNSVPRAPDRLKGVQARAMWRIYAADLWHLGLLPRVSRTALFRFCVAWQFYCDALEKAELHGSVVPTKSGNLIINPYLAVVNRQAEIMRTLEQEFGMTPSSKTRVEGTPVAPPDSSPSLNRLHPIDPEHAFDEFLGGN